MKRFWLPPLIAHVLAWAAFFGVVFWPEAYSRSPRAELVEDELRMVFFSMAGPFRRYLGFEEIMLLLVPVVLTGLAIWLAWPRGARSAWAKPALWGLGVLFLAYCCVLILFPVPIWFNEDVDISFIGVFFVPAAVALIVSAVIVTMSKQPRISRQGDDSPAKISGRVNKKVLRDHRDDRGRFGLSGRQGFGQWQGFWTGLRWRRKSGLR